jgi:E3 Ubiquitin ligase
MGGAEAFIVLLIIVFTLVGAAVVFLAFFVVLGLAGVGIFAAFFAKGKQRRKVAATVRTPIAEAPVDAPVKIVGRVQPATASLEAPLSERPCVGWEVVLESLNTNRSWHELARTVGGDRLVVRDDTGEVVVDLGRARTMLQTEDTFLSSPGRPGVPQTDAFLERYELVEKTRPMGIQHHLRFREGILEEGEQVAVVGRVRRDADPPVVEPDPEQGLLVTDEPKLF